MPRLVGMSYVFRIPGGWSPLVVQATHVQWSVLRGTLVAVAVSLALLAGCGGSTGAKDTKRSTHLTVRIELRTTRVVAGKTIKGTLIVANPGKPINLTQVEHPLGQEHPIVHCMPDFAVYLKKGRIQNPPAFTTSCTSGAFVIAHGENRLPFSISTGYSTCFQDEGVVTPSMPHCLANGGMPNLPPGQYKAVISWSEIVPLPTPRPVDVTLVGASS